MKNKISLLIKGLIIGTVEIIPGVSGGTMALILGIYERLITSISRIDLVFINKLFKREVKEAWKYADCNFLLILVFGMTIAVFSMASLINYLNEYHPFFLKGFFSGLLFCSLFFKPLKLQSYNLKIFFGGVISLTIVALIFSFPSHSEIEDISYIYIFFGGFISVCAFILPGISGSFILLFLGIYGALISAITQLDLLFLGTLLLGCLSGLFLFIRLLKKGFEKFRETLSGLFYFLVLMSIALIWKDGVWSINFPNQSESLEPFLGFLFGSILIYLLHKISFIFQDT